MMKLRLAAPEVLIDIAGISKLRGVSETPDGIAIGALTTHNEVAASEIVRRGCPVLAEAAAGIGDRQVRARGTIGGAIAQADPHGDLPAVLLALDGSVEVQGPNGGRTIAAADLFKGFLTTALEPGEMLTEVRVPTGVRGTYVKFNRRAQDWAIVGVCAVRDGASVRIAITGADLRPVRATAAEQAFNGSNAAEAAELAAEGLHPDRRRGRVGRVSPAPGEGADQARAGSSGGLIEEPAARVNNGARHRYSPGATCRIRQRLRRRSRRSRVPRLRRDVRGSTLRRRLPDRPPRRRPTGPA